MSALFAGFDVAVDAEKGSEDYDSLERTPTWAVGAVCIVFVVSSLMVQRSIYYIGVWLENRKQKPLYEALQKMKEELMLLGFISLLLTVSQNAVSRICMPVEWKSDMLPCEFSKEQQKSSPSVGEPSPLSPTSRDHHRRLLYSNFDEFHGLYDPRRLAFSLASRYHCKEGHVPALTIESLHQLHIFIFVMAVVHVVYSCITILCGFTQIRGWRKWEAETQEENYDSVNGIRNTFKVSLRNTFKRQSTFVATRTSHPWTTSIFLSWIISFFQQFGQTVTKADYLTLRLGFIKNHNVPMKFDFQKYIARTLEDDFKTIVGISGYLWIFVIIFLILNVHGWFTYFWMSFAPLFMILVVGTKLQQIITTLALETAHSQGVIGEVSIKPRDELFWFNNPHLLLFVIHFVLFQNAFELAYFFWLWVTFGFGTCLMDTHSFIIIRVAMGFAAQILCSYSTLPLYALVTQMGSHYKKAIFDEPVATAITDWRHKAKENAKRHRRLSHSSPPHESTNSMPGGKLHRQSEDNFDAHEKPQQLTHDIANDIELWKSDGKVDASKDERHHQLTHGIISEKTAQSLKDKKIGTNQDEILVKEQIRLGVDLSVLTQPVAVLNVIHQVDVHLEVV